MEQKNNVVDFPNSYGNSVVSGSPQSSVKTEVEYKSFYSDKYENIQEDIGPEILKAFQTTRNYILHMGEPKIEISDSTKDVKEGTSGDKMTNDDYLKLYLEKLDKEREQDRISRDRMIEKFESLSSKTSNEIKDLGKEMESYKTENRRFNIGLLVTVVFGFVAMVISMVQINQGFTQIIQSILK